mmetsp:Transcript_73094/g.201720  ORF Transcript_73094/g.201720 Transcript_73094/m.201720 type:complete len:250 (+) Transcript_73094:1452-2201(+)
MPVLGLLGGLRGADDSVPGAGLQEVAGGPAEQRQLLDSNSRRRALRGGGGGGGARQLLAVLALLVHALRRGQGRRGQRQQKGLGPHGGPQRRGPAARGLRPPPGGRVAGDQCAGCRLRPGGQGPDGDHQHTTGPRRELHELAAGGVCRRGPPRQDSGQGGVQWTPSREAFRHRGRQSQRRRLRVGRPRGAAPSPEGKYGELGDHAERGDRNKRRAAPAGAGRDLVRASQDRGREDRAADAPLRQLLLAA